MLFIFHKTIPFVPHKLCNAKILKGKKQSPFLLLATLYATFLFTCTFISAYVIQQKVPNCSQDKHY